MVSPEILPFFLLKSVFKGFQICNRNITTFFWDNFFVLVVIKYHCIQEHSGNHLHDFSSAANQLYLNLTQ